MKLPKQSKIRWKKGDYISLGKAVAQFNRTKNELETEENKLYLPEDINYNEIKSSIFSRSELNRVIKSLRSFSSQNSELVFEGENLITKWEQRENRLAQRRAIKNLKGELAELNKPLENGFSRTQMGSIEARQIQRSIESIENYNKKVGENYKRTVRRIRSLGSNDYNLRKAFIYQENVLNQLEELKNNIPEFKEVYKYFTSIKNPITFYNTMQQSNILQDFFVWYQPNVKYASYGSHKEIAEDILEQYGIKRINKEETIKSEKYKYKYALITRSGNIVAQSDSKQSLKNIALNSNDAQISNSYIIENY